MLEKTGQLMNFIHKLVEVLRYDNQYAYKLLKQITCCKKTTIELDGYKVYLEANCIDDDYELITSDTKTTDHIQFITTSFTLRRIIAGLITIDSAVIKNEIFISGTFDDIFSISKLTAFLLSEGPLNNNLRCLWQEFNDIWNNYEFPLGYIPLEEQVPQSDFLVNLISESVLLVHV